MYRVVKLSCSQLKWFPKFSKPKQTREFSKRVRERIVTEAPVGQSNNEVNKLPLILKSFLFTTGFSGLCFSVATIAQYERLQSKKNPSFRGRYKYSQIREELNEVWNSLSGVKKIVVGIICVNSVILLAGRVLARPLNGAGDLFRRILIDNFYLSPSSRKMSQMLFAPFNHGGLLHLGANMFALYSLSGIMDRFVAPEQFTAFYLSSAVFSSFCSKAFNLALSRNIMSVGASGAVVSCFTLCCFFYPNTSFYIFPLPWPIEAEQLLKIIIGIDLTGLVLGFKVIDHMAHLGGAFFAFALFGTKEGQQLFKQFQLGTIQRWKAAKEYIK